MANKQEQNTKKSPQKIPLLPRKRKDQGKKVREII